MYVRILCLHVVIFREQTVLNTWLIFVDFQNLKLLFLTIHLFCKTKPKDSLLLVLLSTAEWVLIDIDNISWTLLTFSGGYFVPFISRLYHGCRCKLSGVVLLLCHSQISFGLKALSDMSALGGHAFFVDK